MPTTTTNLSLPRPVATDTFTMASYQNLIDTIDTNAAKKADVTTLTNKATSLETKQGNLANLQTVNKTDIVAALNEAFQNANSYKSGLVGAIGTINTSDTFTTINEFLQTQKDNLAAHLTNHESVSSGSDNLKTLVDRVGALSSKDPYEKGHVIGHAQVNLNPASNKLAWSTSLFNSDYTVMKLISDQSGNAYVIVKLPNGQYFVEKYSTGGIRQWSVSYGTQVVNDIALTNHTSALYVAVAPNAELTVAGKIASIRLLDGFQSTYVALSDFATPHRLSVSGSDLYALFSHAPGYLDTGSIRKYNSSGTRVWMVGKNNLVNTALVSDAQYAYIINNGGVEQLDGLNGNLFYTISTVDPFAIDLSGKTLIAAKSGASGTLLYAYSRRESTGGATGLLVWSKPANTAAGVSQLTNITEMTVLPNTSIFLKQGTAPYQYRSYDKSGYLLADLVNTNLIQANDKYWYGVDMALYILRPAVSSQTLPLLMKYNPISYTIMN
jgi:hypothetical protein